VPSTIFVIDSSPAVRRMVEQISTPEGFDVVGFQDGPAALEAARRMSPALIITDYHLDSMTFSGFCKEVHKLDNLADTYIIALTGATDKLENTHLKALGVKAFLKKPFQSEHLLDLIKDLDRTNTTNISGKKKRSWPPTSSALDSDDEFAGDSTDAMSDEELHPIIPMTLDVTPVKNQATKPPVPEPASSTPPAAEPEEAMKGLFGQLLDSMSGKTEKKIADMLPHMVNTGLEAQVSRAVEAEVQLQLGAAVSQERLTEMIEPLVMQALPKILTSEMTLLEPIIRHSMVEIASPLIKEHIEHMVREQAETVRQSLQDAVREHLRSVEEEVRAQLKEVATAETKKLATDVVRTIAEDQIRTSVQMVAPSIVEEQIRAEIARLTDAA
jgi:DNA-binding response OmpR family regulator